MKKVLLTFAVLAALAITSCKDNAKADTTEETKTETNAENSEEKTTETSSGAPSFSDSDVQAYVDTYEAYLASYTKAVEAKDMNALADLATKGQELGTMAQGISGKMTGADGERLAAYMTEKAEELQKLSKKMME